MKEVFLTATRNAFIRDISVRRFIAKLGGVYGDMEKIAPNPYLKIKDREIKANNNKTYTLINPAYFIRIVYQIMLEDYGIKSRITSFKTLNPNNEPNEWEKIALKEFEKGKKEFYDFIEENGEKTFFYIAPLFVEESCLLCHKEQGYKIGDLRGGISIYLKSNTPMLLLSKINKTGISIITLLYLIFFYLFLKYNKKINEHITTIRNKEDNLQKITKKTRSLIIKFNRQGIVTYINKDIKSVGNIKVNTMKDFLDTFKEQDKKFLSDTIKVKEPTERELETVDGNYLLINVDYIDEETIIFIDDITEHKKYTAFLEYFTNKLSLKTEMDFFNDLNNYITQNLGVDYSFIGVFTSSDKRRVKTISVSYKGKKIDNFEYDLQDTPCDNVINKSFCIYTDNVYTLYPKDLFLKDFGIKGYAGIPIFSNDGNVIGIFAFLSENPIKYPNLIENTIKVVSQKIASDLEKIEIKKTINLIGNILEKSNLGIMITNKDYDVIYKNENFYQDKLTSLLQINEQWVESFLRDIRHKENLQMEFPIKENNEQKFYFLSIYHIEVENSEYYLFLKEDITQYKKVERQLIQSQKMEALGALSAGIVHDFNNILTAILNYANLIILSIQDKNISSYGDNIKKCVDLASNLTKDLLIFSRREPHETNLTDLNVIVSNIYKILIRTFPRDISILMNLYKGKIISKINVNQIEQTLMNILINAKDAMPNGGKIFIETNTQTLDDPESGLTKDYGVIIITDTGCGIPSSIIDKIFDPFFTTKEAGKGTGFGLSIAYQIVKQHNGLINVYSEENIGTTFKIYLPIYKETITLEDTTPVESEPLKLRPIGKTALIVDDEDFILDSLEQFLAHNLACTVITAKNGKEGLKKFKENIDKIDISITDYMMPEMDGLTLINEIVKLKENIPIILMTGFGNLPVDVSNLKLKKFLNLRKPFSFNNLMEFLNDLFNS